jgi:polar amino acid transport system substrate-binding protein
MEKDLIFESRNGGGSSAPFPGKEDAKRSAAKERTEGEGQNGHSLTALLIELIHRIKNPLVSIKTFTQLLREKFDDPEFKNYFHKVVTEDIEKIDSVLNGLLNYVKIMTPLEKTGTVHTVLEAVLQRYQNQFAEKRIKIFKKYEKDLPETTVPEEQLRYIFNSLLQYAIRSIPENGSIGFLTKSPGDFHEDRNSIEIMLVFTGIKRPAGQLEQALGIPAAQEEKAIELELRLVQEIIQKNRGNIRFEVNEKKPRTLISMKFPIERRKTFYYPSTDQD